MMRRTQISLGEDERRVLDEVAARTGRSLSSLIREAVAVHFGHRQDDDAVSAGLEHSFGAWQDRDFDGAEYVERLRTGARSERLERRARWSTPRS